MKTYRFFLFFLMCLVWLGYRPHAKAQMPQQYFSSPAKDVSLSAHEGAWLPLSVYQVLKKQASQKPMPRSAYVIEARYQAKVQTDGMVVEAHLEVASQGEGWHDIPVLLGAYPLLSAHLEGQAPMLSTSSSAKDWTTLLLFGAHQKVLYLRFFVPRKPGLDPVVSFQGVPAVASSLQVHFSGASYRPTLEGGMDTRIVRKPDAVKISTILNHPEKGVTLRWWQQETTHQIIKKGQRKSRMYVRTYALLSVAKAGQEMFLTYRYTLVQAPRERFLLRIPQGLQIRTVRGLGLRDYRLRPDPKHGGQLLDVLLIEPVSERYELSILAERRHVQAQMLRLPVPLGAQREKGFVGIEAVGNEEIKVHSTGANAIDVQELPKEIIRGTTRPLLYAFRFTRRPATWRLEVKRHKSVSLPASMVDRAEYLQVVNQEGISWVQAAYKVRNSFKQFMAMRLPKGARIRSAFVDRLPVKPAMDAKKRALIPLKRSGKATSRAFSVEVVYSIDLPKVKSYRRYRYALPQVDLWISAMSWRLYVPDGRITIHKTDLQKEWSSTTARWHTVQGGELSSSPSNQDASSIISQTGTAHANASNDGAGQLPVRVNLPRVGQIYLFHRFHVPAMKGTAVEFTFVGHLLQTISAMLFFFAGLFWGLAIALWMMHFVGAFRWAWLLAVQGFLAFGFAAWTLGSLSWSLLIAGGLCGACVAFLVNILRWIEKSRKAKA